jgi:nucleoside-diphosphate-sugar epimerase
VRWQAAFLGFRAEVDFDEGLRRTIEWYRADGRTRRQNEET